MAEPDLISIWYSPLPEDGSSAESASQEYANRLYTTFKRRQDEHDQEEESLIFTINEPILLDPDIFVSNKNGDDDNDNANHVHNMIFVISCAADGSVHRSVRKVMRLLKNNPKMIMIMDNSASASATEDGAVVVCTPRYSCSVALLGHARCENSANQMKDTIFGTGKRFAKAWSSVNATVLLPGVETQAELEGPEEVFDPWVEDVSRQLFPKNKVKGN